MSSTGQLSVVTFVFQEDSCVLVKLFPLELSDLFLFISLLCSVMYERSITANLCDATHKCRNRSMANKSLYFSVFFVHLFASFVYFSWQLFGQLESFYSWYWLCENTPYSAEFLSYYNMYMYLINGFYLKECSFSLSSNCT